MRFVRFAPNKREICGNFKYCTTMNRLDSLEHRIKQIELRDKRVETDKAWETSWTRKILVALLTYVVIWLYLVFVVGLPNPFINALVPTLGFLLSTLSIDLAKKFWLKFSNRK